jgi:uncharacterized cupin superfamily protein
LSEVTPPAAPIDAALLRRLLIRNFDAAPKSLEQRAPLYESLCARLGDGTAAAKLGISIDIVAPGKRSCPYHFHYAREEAFVVLEGEGTLRVAGQMLALRAGDVVFIPPGPGYPHQIINTSDAPLKYLSISTLDNPEVVVYPDSDKYLLLALHDAGAHRLRAIHRANDDLDYWDGEP